MITAETQAKHSIESSNLELSGQKLTSYLNKKIKSDKATKNRDGLVFWNEIKWMKSRKSMKSWTLGQFIERINETNAIHNINFA